MNFKKSIGWLIVIIIVFSCQKVPITGRNQLHIIPESELISLSLVQYKEEDRRRRCFINESTR